MAKDGEKKLEVRTLSGESTTVSIATTTTISNLKLLLTRQFPPATSSPNFHLFLKGVKLSVQSSIATVTVEPGDFLVLIPFIKKQQRQETLKSDFSSNLTKQSSSCSYTDSVYSDMMSEFSSSLQDSSNIDSVNFVHKRKRGFEYDDDDSSNKEGEAQFAFLLSVLKSPRNDIFEDLICEKFVEVLESLNCLTSLHSGTCALGGWGSDGDVGIGMENGVSCLCPLWLKRIMKVFAFLNIFSAYLRIVKEKITSACLKEALKQLNRFGFSADYKDIEHITNICPKVVSFANNDSKVADNADALVIINSETEEVDEYVIPRNGKKSISLSLIFTMMKKRENSFKIFLWEAAKLLMNKRENAVSMPFSLEDLLNFVKGNATKQERGRRGSSARGCNSVRRCCHETNHLLPVEMVQHLREGIGSNGHVVHVEVLAPRKAIYAEIPHELSDNTKLAMKCLGVTKLYIHQEKSIRASLAGKNVVVSTMTSSGKSLCYNVPVLEVLSQNLSSCALYLFPTKALAQDQLRALGAMTKEFDTGISMGIYDGDTTQAERPWLRENARVVFSMF